MGFLDTPAGQLPTARQVADALRERVALGVLGFGAAEAVTIDSGEAVATKTLVRLDPESNTTDTLDSITLVGQQEGDILILTVAPENTITVDDASIGLGAATRDIGAGDTLVLRFDGTSWVEVAFTGDEGGET